jgi:hypothetical protein
MALGAQASALLALVEIAVSPDFTVIPYDPTLKTEWDDIVRAAVPTHFMFQRGFLEYHAQRFEEASVVILDKGRPKAIIPATREGSVVTSHGGLTFGTVLAKGRVGLLRMRDMLAVAAEHFAGIGAKDWTLKPLPHIYHSTAADDDICAATMLGGVLHRRDTATAVHPRQERALSSERRRALAKGQAAGFSLQESDRITEFVALVADVLHKRHGTAPVHSANELELLRSRFPDQVRLYTAEDTDSAIQAGVLAFVTPTVMHAQYIAASDEARRAGGLDVLTAHLLDLASRDGRWFDFGISNERDGSINEGLARNKEGYGGRSVAYDRYLLAL